MDQDYFHGPRLFHPAKKAIYRYKSVIVTYIIHLDLLSTLMGVDYVVIGFDMEV